MSEQTKQVSIYDTEGSFSLAVRQAESIAASGVVPKDYQNNVANCLIAMEMSKRMNVSPVMVMQNMYIIQGRPSWGAPFIIGLMNASKKFVTDFDVVTGEDPVEGMWTYGFVGEPGQKGYKKGPRVSMKMAKAEGWVDKSGSKWKNMPELMLNYRAAAFFGRLHCPELLQGMHMEDEVIDMAPEPIVHVPVAATEIKVDDVNEMIKKRAEQTASTPNSAQANEMAVAEEIAFEEVVTETPEKGPEQAPDTQGVDSGAPGQTNGPSSSVAALTKEQKDLLRAKYNVYVELHNRFANPGDAMYSPDGFLTAINEGRLKDTCVSREIPTYSLGDMQDAPKKEEPAVNNDDLT